VIRFARQALKSVRYADASDVIPRLRTRTDTEQRYSLADAHDDHDSLTNWKPFKGACRSFPMWETMGRPERPIQPMKGKANE
jgi:hypothetical protein